jgi:hypothetical protein
MNWSSEVWLTSAALFRTFTSGSFFMQKEKKMTKKEKARREKRFQELLQLSKDHTHIVEHVRIGERLKGQNGPGIYLQCLNHFSSGPDSVPDFVVENRGNCFFLRSDGLNSGYLRGGIYFVPGDILWLLELLREKDFPEDFSAKITTLLIRLI